MTWRSLPLLAACALLASCSAVRMAYDNADTALRFMASSYLELDPAQAEDMSERIVRFHQWHRRTEVPAYAALMRSASERASRGITAEDVAWGLDSVRSRYRKFAARAAEEAAPVLTTLNSAQVSVLERKFADNNEKFEKDFLPADDAKRRRAQTKRMLERFRDFTGDLTADQQARIDLFVLTYEKHVALRYEDRRQWQRQFVTAIRTLHGSPALGAGLADIFNHPEKRRTEAFIREDRAWDEGLAQLIVELDGSLSPKQRAHVVRRLSEYASDFAALAGGKEAA